MDQNLAFQQLFEAYKSNYSNSRMTPGQVENLRVWHERRGRTGITLSQADEWMMQAGVIQKKVLSITDTGQTFSRLKQFSLNEQQFQDYLKTLCNEKQLNLEEMQSKLLSVGPPPSPSSDDSL